MDTKGVTVSLVADPSKSTKNAITFGSPLTTTTSHYKSIEILEVTISRILVRAALVRAALVQDP